jgi:hypothetical protein
MSETATPAAKPLNRWFWLRAVPAAAVVGVPAAVGIQYFTGLHDSTLRDRVQGGIAWIFVSVVTGLTAYALYRIKVNMAYNRRPFTPKDRAYCNGAACTALLGAVAIAASQLIWKTPTSHSIGLVDVLSAQTLACIIVSWVLFLLAEVHKRGAELFDELEQGV